MPNKKERLEFFPFISVDELVGFAQGIINSEAPLFFINHKGIIFHKNASAEALKIINFRRKNTSFEEFVQQLIAENGSLPSNHVKEFLTEDLNTAYLANFLPFPDKKGYMVYCRDISAIHRKNVHYDTLLKLLKDAPFIELITDIKGNITWVNNAFIKNTGYSFDEVIGKQPGNILRGPETDLELFATIDAKIQNKETVNFVILNYRKNGEAFWVKIYGKPIYSDNEIFKGYHFIQFDITEQIEQQELQQDAISKYSASCAALKDGLLFEEADGKIGFVNKAFCKILELNSTPETLQKADFLKSIESADKLFPDKNVFKESVNNKKSKRRLQLGNIIKLTDGRYIKQDFYPLSQNDFYVGGLWRLSDVTVEKRYEELLSRNEEKFQKIINNMNLGLLEVSNNDEILFANKAFCDITGFDALELIGNKTSDLLVVADTERLITEKIEDRKQGKGDLYEIPIKDKNGKIKWLAISGLPLYNEDGTLKGSVGVHLDITRRIEAEEEVIKARKIAEDSSKSKQVFFAKMSHEIRTPMNAIIGLSKVLEETKLDVNQNKYLNAIRQSAESLLVVINDILDISKIDTENLKIEQINFDLKELLYQLKTSMQIKADEKKLNLVLDIADDGSNYITSDPYRINQILVNLVGNSIKFTSKGEIKISCTYENKNENDCILKITIADTGVGIDQKYLKNIFSEFSQEDESTTRKFGGTGLGLSISKKLSNLLGGDLKIESKKNEWTKVYFSIPVKINKSKPKKEEKLDLSNINLSGTKILIVDDNEFNRLLATTLLNKYNANYIECTNGLEALKLLQEESFDVVLLDMQMPIISGYDTAKMLHSVGNEVPIIALTANAMKGEEERCLSIGMKGYLAKPFTEITFIAEIKRVINLKIEGKNKSSFVSKQTSLPTEIYNISYYENSVKGNRQFLKAILKKLISEISQININLRLGLVQNNKKEIQFQAFKLSSFINNLEIKILKEDIKQLTNEEYVANQDMESLDIKITYIGMVIKRLEELIVKNHL
jgi:PAS domain S-box-containing protein